MFNFYFFGFPINEFKLELNYSSVAGAAASTDWRSFYGGRNGFGGWAFFLLTSSFFVRTSVRKTVD